MAKSGPPGGATIDRLASRSARGQLTRMSMPGGGEVFKGPLASRALKRMGARAMTVDRSVIVGDGFNPSKAEDQALFAHEMHHVKESGGEGGHHGRDGEEADARAVEAMVFHRAAAGGYEGGYQPGGNERPSNSAWNDNNQNSQRHTPSNQGSSDKPESVNSSPDPARGYNSLLAQGLSHDDVVQDMARRVISAMDDQQQSASDRWTSQKAWT